MERAVFDRMAELDQDHWWFLARRRILKRLIERVVRPPKKAKILELGCGTGHNLAMLKAFGSLEASELDRCARAVANQRLPRRVKNAKLPDLSKFKRNVTTSSPCSTCSSMCPTISPRCAPFICGLSPAAPCC